MKLEISSYEYIKSTFGYVAYLLMKFRTFDNLKSNMQWKLSVQ